MLSEKHLVGYLVRMDVLNRRLLVRILTIHVQLYSIAKSILINYHGNVHKVVHLVFLLVQ